MAESESPSAFSISDDEVTRVLQNGSGFANGKMRIQTLYASEHDPKKRADYLKDGRFKGICGLQRQGNADPEL